MVKGKHIVLCITGGIAAYKSASLLRLFIKGGAEVQVVMTPVGKRVYNSGNFVGIERKAWWISEFFTANTGSWNSHVDLGLWADALVVAPATACTIAKMANGVADNMLVTTYLSAKAPVFIAPAMDLDMMAHRSTQDNIAKLRSYGNLIIEPASGELASHLVGKGRMEEPEKIFEVVSSFFESEHDLAGRKVLITAGPTYEKIDPVRFIGNYSSGKMGYALADECARRGADVVLVSGPVSVKPSQKMEVVKVESGRQMLAACEKRFGECDVAIMCAAVADYYVDNVADKKIKREHGDVPTLNLKKNPDIAATIGKAKRVGQIVAGFALETDNERYNAMEKLHRKNLDFIVLNSLRDADSGFSTDNNTISIIGKDGSIVGYDNKPKTEVAKDIVDYLKTLL